ncbi:MAG: FHA domain-containing protein [Anaerolineae bacterium]|nr:FHA domain-containing protein [Anaerolineae bacterium]
MQCPDCHHENLLGVNQCEACGLNIYDLLMDDVETKQLARFISDELELDKPSSSQPLLLYLPSLQTPIAIARRPSLAMGRKDPESTLLVDIDLTRFDAQALGVSRQHARLEANQMLPVLLDLNSYNGTFINGQQLTPNEPYELKSGDEIRLGSLIASLYFK